MANDDEVKFLRIEMPSQGWLLERLLIFARALATTKVPFAFGNRSLSGESTEVAVAQAKREIGAMLLAILEAK